jgi:serine/threonine protein kinase/WD40 repeat protein
MTRQNSNGSDAESGKDQPLYGTQVARFGSNDNASNASADIPAATATHTGAGQNTDRELPAYGTQFAAPIHQQQAASARLQKELPSLENFEAVSQTRRVDPQQLRDLIDSEDPGETQQQPAARVRSVTESEKTVIMKRISEKIEQAAGKSTWDLRIHRRDVQGQISGIINPIPESGAATTGLQSALAVDDDAPEYDILGQLGAGNMGIVYHARQLSLNRELAIKTLKPNSGQTQHDQAMFVSEAVVTANLVHPNIVPIHDLGRTHDGKLFYSMKKVTGVSWNEILRERTLEDNLDIFMKLCDAVAYAHSRGVINRDLKPENVVVGNYGEVVVLDWGLAITTDLFEKRRSVLVDFRGGAGTPVYMAPELLDDDLSRVGPHSDIYLLGAILFEILEGFPPHLLRSTWQMTEPGEQFNAVYRAVMYNEIEADVVQRGELMQIARKALSTEPTSRFPSVESLQNAIREYRITGRAEELMNSIDSRQLSDYTTYQSAVALYSEALLKWPNNRRAIDGDRNARLAYAELAQKKGDIDLGLQVVSAHADPTFAPVVAKLKRTRLIRSIVRGTWGVTTVSAVSLLLYSWILWTQAVQAKDELVAKNGELAEVQEKVEVANAKAQDAIRDADAASEKAKTAIKEAEVAIAQGEQAKRGAKIEVEKATETANRAKAEAEAASMLAETAKSQAEKAQAAAAKASAEAKTATAAAEVAKAEAIVALKEKHESESEGFTKKIEASQELGDFDAVIRVAKDALTRVARNPLLKQKEVALQKTIEEAVKNGGNAQIRLQDTPNSAAISADGTTVIVYSGGLEKSVTVFKGIGGLHGDRPDPQRIPITLKGSVNVTVSSDGSCICLATASGIQLWQLQSDRYKEINLNSIGAPFNIGWTFFSRDGKHVYVVGKDKQATVDIYSVSQGAARPFPRQRLAGEATTDFRIRDLVLLPDETALIAQFEIQPCYEYRINWSNKERPTFDKLAINAPRLNPFRIEGLTQAPDQPERLFVSPDGERLGMTFSDTIIFLPRIPNARDDEFSFANPETSAAGFEILNATYRIQEVRFSKDRQRIATGHGNRYVQLWDLDGKDYQACNAEGLFEHRRSDRFATCLRGHSKEIQALAFANGDADHLLSVSAGGAENDHGSIRTWQISTYATLVSQMQEIRDVFEQHPIPPTAFVPLRSDLLSADSLLGRQQTTGDRKKMAADLRQMAEYIPTAGPGTQPAAANEPHRITQGQAIYSARFSPDAKRFLIGADDLAAHAFDSETGKEIMTASMLGRKDLLFDPSRNMFLEGHVSEISAIRFLPPNGDLLLSADYFGSISAWDAVPDDNGAGFERSRLFSEYSFSEFAVSSAGDYVIAGGAMTANPGGALEEAKLLHKGVLWRTADILQSPSPTPFREFEGRHPDFAITAVGISPASERVVTAGRRGKIVVWQIADGQVIAEADGLHNSDQVSGMFFESETEMISAGYDGKVFRLTVEGDEVTAKPVDRSHEGGDPDFIVRLRPSPDRRRFATSEVSLLKGKKSGQLNVTIWSVDGTRSLLSQAIDIPENDKELAFRHDVSWSSDGRELLLIQDGVIAIFDTTEWKLLRKFKNDERTARPVRGAFAPSIEGRSDRIATFDGRVMHLWNLVPDGTSGEHVAEFRSHARYAVTASYSSDEKFVATASETLRIFDADEKSPNHGSTLYRLPVGSPHKSPLADTAFSPVLGDSRLAAIDQHGTVSLWQWDPNGPKPLTALCDALINDFEKPDWATDLPFGNITMWNPNGKSLATLQSGVISLWTLMENIPGRIELPLPTGLQCRFNQLHFSEDGDVLTAGGVAWSEDSGDMFSFAAIWNVAEQMPRLIAKIDKSDRMHSVETQSTHQKGITAIAIDDLRHEIVTGGADNRLIRWQMAADSDTSIPSLTRIADVLIDSGTSNPHRAVITAVDISAKGQMLTADEKGNAILWPAPAN